MSSVRDTCASGRAAWLPTACLPFRLLSTLLFSMAVDKEKDPVERNALNERLRRLHGSLKSVLEHYKVHNQDKLADFESWKVRLPVCCALRLPRAKLTPPPVASAPSRNKDQLMPRRSGGKSAQRQRQPPGRRCRPCLRLA